MLIFFLAIFAAGYLCIALENRIGINKAASALVLGMLLWFLSVVLGGDYVVAADSENFALFLSKNPMIAQQSKFLQIISYIVNFQIPFHLGDIASTIFYLLGAMVVVEIINMYDGFSVIIDRIKIRNKRKLLFVVSFLTFAMSAVLDNLTTAMVMIMLVKQIVPEKTDRWIFGSVVVLAANAGGAWSPIGDVTTIMLWVNNRITGANVIVKLLLPSFVSLIIPLVILSFRLHGKIAERKIEFEALNAHRRLPHKIKNRMLTLGICALVFVPVFKAFTSLPPFVGIMFSLGMLWVYTDLLYNRHNIAKERQFRIPRAFKHVDFSTQLFFFGILMAVAALQTLGILGKMSVFLDAHVHDVFIIDLIIGIASAVIDNVPIVAAAIGMYPLADVANASPYMMNFIVDGHFWQLLAYCAGVGGSILIIGSAAGVVVMGKERITFMWYLKNISPLALLGYIAGALTYIYLI